MDAYLGEIKCFAGDYAPKGWFICAGQVLKISDYNALYSLLGIQYGGDGITTFALPDLRGRAPMGSGSAPGLTTRVTGQLIGTEAVALTTHEIPNHFHSIVNQTTVTNNLSGNGTGTIKCLAATGNADTPKDNYPANAPNRTNTFSNTVASDLLNSEALQMNANVEGNVNIHISSQCNTAGNSVPHNNMQPWSCLNFIICYSGIYPPRS
jgi:microcystin-dependent protein